MGWFKKLFFLYIGLVVIKIILVSTVSAPSNFADGYIYAKMARSFFYAQTFLVHDELNYLYPPLYSIILSLSYIFKDMNIVYFSMKVINSLISSLIIIPAWLLGKEFLSERRAFLFTILASVIPSSFSTTVYIMSENLFYVLFLFLIYFLYKSFTDDGYKFDVLAGFFLSLLLITRTISIFLIPVILLVSVVSLFRKQHFQIKKKLVLLLTLLVSLLPFISSIYQLLISEVSSRVNTMSSPGAETISNLKEGFMISLFTWPVLYLGFLTLGIGILFFILAAFNFRDSKDENFLYFKLISIFSLIFIILFATGNAISSIVKYESLMPSLLGRPIGRYVDGILPLILLNGFIGLNILKNKRISLKFVLPFSFLLAASAILVSFPLFPFNNVSLTFVGLLKYIFEYLVYNQKTFDTIYHFGSVLFFAIVFFLIPISFTFFKLNTKKIFYIFFTFFMLINLSVFAVENVNSDIWYNSDQMQLGLWVNEYDRDKVSKILFDEDYLGKATKTEQDEFLGGRAYTIAGFWMNDNIKYGNISNLEDYDFIVTKKDMGLPLLIEKGKWKFYSTN